MENREKGMRADGLGHPALFFLRRRYFVAIMAWFGYIASYSTRVNLSVAILYLTGNYTETLSNGTEVQKRHFDWDKKTQGLILASFFYGYIVTQLPGGYLASQIGGNHVLNIGVAGSGLVSLVGPSCVKLGVGSAIAMRVVCGLFQGFTVPAVNSLWARWAPPLERTVLTMIAISGNFFSSIIVMPICSVIGDHLGWEWMFYICGIVSVVWSLIWYFTVFAGPEIDKFIKESELKFIQESIGERTDKKPIHPWKKIFSSMPVGAFVVSYTGHNWGFYTVLLLGPKYYKHSLDYSVKLSTIFAGISFAIAGILMIIFGNVSDMIRRRKLLTTVGVRKMFCCGGFAIQVLFMLLLAFIRDRECCVAFAILAIGMGGITWSALNVNPLDIAAPHAPVISGIGNTFATLPGIFSPMVATLFFPNHEDPKMGDWMWVWIISAAVYGCSAIFFAIFAKGEKQSWVYKPES